MCGIAGFVGQGTRAVLERMTNALRHRGPNDAGFFVEGPVGLGHRRLSIIDLSPLGHQPMESARGEAVIVFNGEIYNFRELRRELETRGHAFRGGSDTEVILACYLQYGTDCFEKMNGMFAFALYDRRTRALILARDRLGKKPLYWARFGETFLFGSELKALMRHPAFQKEINPLSLQKYFAFDYIPTPHTIFKSVYKLEPGTALVFKDGKIEKQQFWDIRFGDRHGSKKEIIAEMNSRLERAVVSRLVSDVPLGIFLSGGLDSSTIAYYAQKNSRRPIQTFSIGFEEKSFDESEQARLVSDFLGTDHHHQVLTAKDALDLIPRMADVLDEPMADYSIIPTYLLSKFTRQHVTVALGGDGGDELFLGYPTFQAERLLPLLRAGAPALTLLQKILPVSHAHFNAQFKIQQLLQGLHMPEQYRHHAWMGTFIEQIRDQKLEIRNIFGDIDRYWERVKNEPKWNKLVYLYLRTYLMDQVLVKVDRASMAASLEVRAPFLDYEFVDFVNSIHYNKRIHGLTTKYLLKELMRNKLPHEIVYRKKQGFGVPLAAWFAGELRPWVTDLLSPARIRREGIFDPEAVMALLNGHFAWRSDNRKQLWSLLIWEMWQMQWAH